MRKMRRCSTFAARLRRRKAIGVRRGRIIRKRSEPIAYTRGPAILASVLGVAAFDFLFVNPYYTFTVTDQQYLITFTVMLITALVISALTLRLRARAREAQEAWERVEAEFLRNTLLSAVSHDLRTPLAAITGASSTLIESGASLSS